MSNEQKLTVWIEYRTTDGLVRGSIRVCDMSEEQFEAFFNAGLRATRTWVENAEGEIVQ